VRYRPELPETGDYELFLIYGALPNRAGNTPVTVAIDRGASKTVRVNQKTAGKDHRTSLGRFTLPAGRRTTITISNEGTDGYVIADGVQLLPVD
jgi:hypothetical protein